jgi:hypothetical protein
VFQRFAAREHQEAQGPAGDKSIIIIKEAAESK